MDKQLFFIVFSLFTFVCCKKEKEPITQPFAYWGESSFQVNGSTIEASPYSFLVEPDSTVIIILNVLNPSETKTGSLSFHNIPIRTGVYPLQKRVWSLPDNGLPFTFFHELADDVILGEYNLLESKPSNQFTITSFDKETNELMGTFDVTFVLDSLDKILNPTLLDTLRFSDGYFHTKVRRQ